MKSSAWDVMTKSGIGAFQHKVVEERWGDGGGPVRPPPAPGGKASGAADRGTRPYCRGSMPQATSPNCDGVGSSGSSR